jgi:DHA1 family tetracycline resistance protein-like MFS transporter
MAHLFVVGPEVLVSSSRIPGGSLLLIFVIAFMNTAGATIVMPVLPFITIRYTHDPAVVALWVGILASAYSLCALLAAPALGALSDRLGRKPVLIVSLLGSAAGFLIFGIGGALWVLLLARVIDGLTGGNISTIFAYLADITAPEDRAERFGMVGAIMGAGFMFGPALGGLLAVWGLPVPVFVAAGITLVTALLSAFVLPESLDVEHRSAKFALADVHPFKSIGDALKRPMLRPLLLGVLLLSIPMAGFQTNIGVLSKDTVGWGPAQVGLLLLCVGILDIVVQGGLLRILLPRIGERGVVLVGFVGQAAGYGLIAIVASFVSLPWLFVTGALLFAAAEGGTGPALSSLISGAVSHREQGWVMGALQSMNSGARVIGPLLAGALYSGLGHAAPYWFGLIVVAVLLVVGLPYLRGLQGGPE